MTHETQEMEPLMTDEQVAGVLKVSLATLAAWRCNGRVGGLPYVKVGGAIRYQRAHVHGFIAANVREPGA